MLRLVLLFTVFGLILTAVTPAFADSDERVNLLGYNNGRPIGPVWLQFADEGFFVRFDPQSDEEITLIVARVWISAEGDPGWGEPDRFHQSFTIVVHHADDNDLGDEIYRENVLLTDDRMPHWVSTTEEVSFTGPFFVGAIQANAAPNVEALMHDGSVDLPDRSWTNAGGRWGRCVDRIFDFPGDLLMMCVVERSSAIGDGDNGFKPEIIEIGNFAPNPFNSTTSLGITIHRLTSLQMEVINLRGLSVYKRQFDALSPGVDLLTFDLSDLPSGTYMAKITGAEAPIVKSLTIVK